MLTGRDYANGVSCSQCGSSRRRYSRPQFGGISTTINIAGLQIALMLRPEQGPVIRGSGGLHKVRWATTGAGKRGGLRVISCWAGRDPVFSMVYAYTKAEQGDLTPDQTRQLTRIESGLAQLDRGEGKPPWFYPPLRSLRSAMASITPTHRKSAIAAGRSWTI
ncbi:MAG: hypothetical protein IPM24_16530 [Bryobacterales bacterium]|nr:hypothetical protein [Bryobacterales bacterium]